MSWQSRRSGPTFRRIRRSCFTCLINFLKAESQTESTSSTSSTLLVKTTWTPFASSQTSSEQKQTLKRWKTRWSKSRKTGSKSSRPSPSSQVSHSAHLTFYRAQGSADSPLEEVVKSAVSASKEEKARPADDTGQFQKGRSGYGWRRNQDKISDLTFITIRYWPASNLNFPEQRQEVLNLTLTYLSSLKFKII
jgi:hypothetical protein